MSIIQMARFTIAFVWIYHGLFPKLLQIAPIEMAMSSAAGLSEENTLLLIKLAGFGELIFGIAFIFLYKFKQIIWLNIIALIGLLAYVAVRMPEFLVEAFNPVTTNIPLIILSFILLKGLEEQSTIQPSIKKLIE